MCILLLSSQHPNYPFILLSNRDEYFSRPTRPLQWWHSQNDQERGSSVSETASTRDIESDDLLGGQDLVRGGTWLILSKTGRISALTNFRDEQASISKVSRGALPVAFVRSSSSDFVDSLLSDLAVDGEMYGGFSLLCGDLSRMADGFKVISNRSAEDGVITVMKKTSSSRRETDEVDQFECACELSNSTITTPWPKTRSGKALLAKGIEESIHNHWSQAQLVDRLFDILSTDTLAEKNVGAMKESIFIPEIPLSEDSYGTRQQTVILLNQTGKVKVFERTIKSVTRAKTMVVEEFVLG